MSACTSSLALFLLGPGIPSGCRFCRSGPVLPVITPARRMLATLLPEVDLDALSLDAGPCETNISAWSEDGTALDLADCPRVRSCLDNPRRGDVA